MENRQAKNPSLRLEKLEPRELLAADFLDAVIPTASIDGSGNNEGHEAWGSTDEQLVRLTATEYGDGFNSSAGQDRASAREVSNAVNAQVESIVNSRGLTDMLWLFGQFLDHDISITENADPTEPLEIAVPTGDVHFDPFGTGTQTISLNRSIYEGGTSPDDIRQQLNQITAFIDGSNIYGSTVERMNALREFDGGRLLVSDGNLLPFNVNGLENAGGSSDALFLAGDVRANENIGLIAMHTIWVREHNRIASELQVSNPDLSDEELFQTARAIVRAELQAITFNEFLPAILGKDAISRYQGYNPDVNPNIANEFSTAAYRFGHTMLSSELLRLNPDGTVADEGNIALLNAFFRPDQISQYGIDSILQGMAAQEAQEIDTQVVDDIRNFLFGPPGSGGFDLASLNIQRGRDHGLADYNQTRIDLGLEPVASFADITSDSDLQEKLRSVYGSVDNIDLWIGGLAEDHVKGSSVGETFATIMTDQFSRLRDGDRYWYQNLFQGKLLKQIEKTTLADIIQRNSEVENLQHNVFFSEDAQPERDHAPLIVQIPAIRGLARVVIIDGTVEIRTPRGVKTTLLLDDTRLIIRGTQRADQILLDLRDDSVLQLKKIVVNSMGGNDRVRILGVHDGYSGEIHIRGGKGNDRLVAAGIDNGVVIEGGRGDDFLQGGRRGDRLLGGQGRDQIFGGRGNDLLEGGRGNDILNGQGGQDRLMETLAEDIVLRNRELRNAKGQRDRVQGIENALLVDLESRFQVDFREFRGNVQIRRRG